MGRRAISNRDRLADGNRILAQLLLNEATGGIVKLPKMGGVEYKVPNIEISERRAILDSVNKVLLVDMKIDPEEEMSGFDILKEELGGNKRSGRKSRSGGISSETDDTTGDTGTHETEDGFAPTQSQ